MRITNLQIWNFRSLKNIRLTPLGNLNIFVGKNSSGKSNILEGLNLLFTNFALVGGSTPGLDEFFWFNKKTNNPIDFLVSAQLTEAECREIFPEEMLKMIKKWQPKAYGQLTFRRKILNLRGNWATDLLKLCNVDFIKANKTLTPPEIEKIWRSRGPRRKNQVIPPLNLTPTLLSEIHQKILATVKGNFKLLHQIRDVKNPVANRVALIDSQRQSALWTLDQSTKDVEEQTYSEIQTTFRKITNKQLDPAQGQVYIGRGTRRFPLFLEGGGIQATIDLIFILKSKLEKGFVFGIEEPEAHSHPDLQRKLFHELKSMSEDCQVFLSTHSPIFIDRGNLTNTWIVKFVNGATSVERAYMLKGIIEELGIKPSDVLFFADRILFVEGKTEEIVIPVFAEKLGVNLEGVAVISVEGKTKARLNLKTWVKTTHNALPLFLLLDKDAEEEAKELVATKLIKPRRYHVWQRGSIESYYPHEILSRALEELNSRYGLELNVAVLMRRIKRGELSPDKIDIGGKSKLLDRSWEVLLGESVGRLVKAEKKVAIDEEVKRALKEAEAE